MIQRSTQQDIETWSRIKKENKILESTKKKRASRSFCEETDFSRFEILTKVKYQEKKNLVELENEELMYKDDLDEAEGDEEEEHKEMNMKDKLATYFLAKNKKMGISAGWEVLSNLLFLVDQVLTVFEKMKNLIFWKSPTATMYIVFLLIVAYIGLAFLPIRYLLIGFYIFKFKKGYTYYERIYKHNIE